MSSIPSNLSRVPNLLSSQIMTGTLARASRDLLLVQQQLSSGRRINRASDDPIGTGTVAVLDDVIERRDQRLRNLSHAESVLNNVDAGLDDLNAMLIEAKGIASSQIGIGSDEETRASQALIINAMLAEAIEIGNRRFQDVHLFGGNATGRPPIVALGSGYRYQGEGEGLLTDLGLSRALPITVSGVDAFGAVSARVQGERDLDPVVTGATRLDDLNGARGLGIGLATINVDVNGVDLDVDLTGAHDVQDVIDALQTAIATEDPGAVVDLDPATQNRFRITPSAGFTITISDPATDATAADLGLAGVYPPGVPTAGGDLDPRITTLTPLATLTGVTTPLGTIRVSNLGQTRDLDLSTATTVQDVVNAVEGLDLGVRVEISAAGDRLDFVNELSGGSMSIADVGVPATATQLGVRSYTGSTRLADFNDGLGVQILSGGIDPGSGLPDPARDLDIEIVTRDGTTFAVDFAGATTVQDIIDDINAASGGAVTAALVGTGNGIELTDNTAGAGPFSVARLNGSFAGSDLGLIGSTTGATIVSEDRATVAVESLFSHLIALRDALDTNDERGITLAAGKLEDDITRLTTTRAEVGVRTRRVTENTNREEDMRLQDIGLRSQVQDLDYSEAAIRFGLLEQQMQAALTTASRVSQLSLLDFL